MIISPRKVITSRGNPAEYFAGDRSLIFCCPLLPEYGLMDTVSGNHLIVADVLNDIGTFTNGSTGWSSFPNWTFNNIVATYVNVVGGTLAKSGVLVIGKSYVFEFDITRRVSGGVTPRAGSVLGVQANSVGHHKQTIITDNTGVAMVAGANSDLDIDNLIVREAYNGNISSSGAMFNGVSNGLQTTGNLLLSGTDKISVLANVACFNYNTIVQCIFETSATIATNNGTIGSWLNASIVNYNSVYSKGATGLYASNYMASLTNQRDKNSHCYATIHDLSNSFSTREADYIQDGQLFTPTSVNAFANSGNFADNILYLGMRAGTSYPFNGLMSRFAILTRTISVQEHADFCSWSQDTSRVNFISLHIQPARSFPAPMETHTLTQEYEVIDL